MIDDDEARKVLANLWEQVDAIDPRRVSHKQIDLFAHAVASFEIAIMGYPWDAWRELAANVECQIEDGNQFQAGQVAKLKRIVEAVYL